MLTCTQKKIYRIQKFVVPFLCFSISFTSLASLTTSQVIQSEVNRLSQVKVSQKDIERADDSLQSTNKDIRDIEHEIRLQLKYNQQLKNHSKQIEKSLELLDNELDNIRKVKINLKPLLTEMLEGLKKLINADLPFHLMQRQEKIEKLEVKLSNPALSDSQKLEQLFLAYQTEIELGNTIESWQDRLDQDHEVIFFRVGRIGYYYVSLDNKSGAMWVPKSGWKQLSDNQVKLISTAINIQKNSVKPSLLTIPKI